MVDDFETGSSGAPSDNPLPLPEGGAVSVVEPGIAGQGGIPGPIDMGTGGAPPQGEYACDLYCRGYAESCPQAGFGSPEACTATCVADLANANEGCSEGRRKAYACIGLALAQSPDNCSIALGIAKTECGSATPQVPACHAKCIPSISGGGIEGGCRAEVANCGGKSVLLECEDTNQGGIPCTCLIDGKAAWDIATGFQSSKAACLDEDLFTLCTNEI